MTFPVVVSKHTGWTRFAVPQTIRRAVWTFQITVLLLVLIGLPFGLFRQVPRSVVFVVFGFFAWAVLLPKCVQFFNGRPVLFQDSTRAYETLSMTALLADTSRQAAGFAISQLLTVFSPEAGLLRIAFILVAPSGRKITHRGIMLLFSTLCEYFFRVSQEEHSWARLAVSAVLIAVLDVVREVLLGDAARARSSRTDCFDHQNLQKIDHQADLFCLRESGDVVALSDGVPDRELSVEDSDQSSLATASDRSAAVSVRQNMDMLAVLLRQSLGLGTCAVLWRRKGGVTFEAVAVATHERLCLKTAVRKDTGLIGLVRNARHTVSIRNPSVSQLGYYNMSDRHMESAGMKCLAAMAVPIFDDDRLAAMLVVDRFSTSNETQEFPTVEQRIVLNTAVSLVARILRSERLILAVEEGRGASRALAEASRKISTARRSQDLLTMALGCVRQLCDYDFAALVRFESATGVHTVVSVDGDPAICSSSQSVVFGNNGSLCAMAIDSNKPLPRDGLLRPQQAVFLFDKPVQFEDYRYLHVVPLQLHDRAHGALIVAGKNDESAPERRSLLSVLANQIAIGLDSARLYEVLEATSRNDGLTGLRNRRAFQEQVTEMCDRAVRHQRPLSLILCDIDHFKRVNDTYGHLVGDEVLRKLGKLLAGSLRKVDVAARYGGEEFAILLEAVDEAGAFLSAERIRQEAEKLTHKHENSAFSTTLSLGVATFPACGTTIGDILAAADAALYAAKSEGRNRTKVHSAMWVQQKAA